MDINQETIKSALVKLDHGKDSDWTEEGLPNPDVVFELLGKPETIEKEQTAAYIQWAAPEFVRVKPAETVKPEKKSKEDLVTDSPDSQVDDSPVAVLDAVDVVSGEVEKAEKAFADAQRALTEARLKQDALVLEQEKSARGNPIAEYLERQKQNLALKAAKKQFIADNQEAFEIFKEAAQTKSPLDAALSSRRRNR